MALFDRLKSLPFLRAAAPTTDQAPPRPDAAVQSLLLKALQGMVDQYIYGNPASNRLGPISPVNTYPHLTADGFWSPDSSLFDLYEEMLHKDAHIYGTLATRLAAVTCLERRLVPAGPSPADQDVHEFVTQALNAINPPGFDALLNAILSAIPYGLSVIELGWSSVPSPLNPAQPALLPVRAWRHHPSRFIFDRLGQAFLCDQERTPLPPRRFLISRHSDAFDNPYGDGLLGRLQWLYWFKKNVIRAWLRASERVGQPFVVGKYPRAQAEMKALVEDAIIGMAESEGAAIPDNTTLETLNVSTESGAFGEGLHGLAAFINDETSRLILGATLTSSEGQRSGSLALGQVHNQVRDERIVDDARLAMQSVNTLIAWIVELNFGADVAPPRFEVDTEPAEDLSSLADVYDKLAKMGLLLPTQHVYDRFTIPAPEPGEPTIGGQPEVVSPNPGEPPPDKKTDPKASSDTPAEMSESDADWQRLILGLVQPTS